MNLTRTALAVSCLLAATSAPALADQMTAADIRKLAPGTYHVSVADSVKATVILKTNGSLSLTTDKGEKDTGRWNISGDKFCVVFKHLLDRKQHCSPLTREGNLLRGDGLTARQ